MTGTNVVLFSTPLVVFAGTLANSAKVDSQRGESGIVQSSSGTNHNLIVHRAAAEWMWM
jgi:hypothetical protein